jgi:hypothetical protein
MLVKTLHDTDFDAWVAEQAEALRHGRLGELDLAALAEELEDMSASRRDAVESLLARIIEHLLKLEYSPAVPPRDTWAQSVVVHRDELLARIRKSRTLYNFAREALDDAWRRARKLAVRGLSRDGIPPDALPPACPYTFEQVIDEDWWPVNRHGRE